MQIENISDDDLQNMQVPPSDLQTSEPNPDPDPIITPPPAEEPSLQTEGEDDERGAEGDEEEVQKPEAEDVSDEDLDKQTPTSEPEKTEDKPADPPAEDADKPADKAADTPVEKDADAPVVDFAAEYAKLVGTPIKANGKEITLNSTEEVLRLVQQGANYNKRMSELKPARKSAAMLESAGLLGNEVALSHMIDLYNGKPEAIAKMVKDLNIDVYSLDLESGDKYKPTSHLQSDEAVNFQDTLKEVRTLPGGQEAMQLIDSWDQQSKDLVWGNATAVREIYDYKQSGIYDTVATEVERRRTLGEIPESMPFITAFVAVGNELAATHAAANPTTATPQPSNLAPTPAKPAVRTPVATGIAPRKTEAPDARAAAAASPRGGKAPAKTVMDIYSLSDSDIEKMQAPPS